MLYDEEFINSLDNPKFGWKSPLVVYVAKEASEQNRLLKLYIENWYGVLPEIKKASYFSRLRSRDDKEFLAQIFEFFVADFCKSLGSIDFDPTLADGKTPELLWDFQGRKCLLDVVTLFDQKDKDEANRGTNDLLNYLGLIHHYYNIGVIYKSINLKELKKSAIKKQLIEYLDALDYDSVGIEEELEIENFGFVGSFIPFRRKTKERKNISFSLMGPPEEIEPVNAIQKRIKSKLAKYKWNGPIFVAVCKVAHFGVDWGDVAEVLYGPVVIRYNHSTKEYLEMIGKGGFVMPKGSKNPNNTSLTGILHCELIWGEGLPTLQVKYLMNPFAKHQMDIPIPSYPRVNEKIVSFEWINNGNEEIGQH